MKAPVALAVGTVARIHASFTVTWAMAQVASVIDARKVSKCLFMFVLSSSGGGQQRTHNGGTRGGGIYSGAIGRQD
jgi:hypothetical protein